MCPCTWFDVFWPSFPKLPKYPSTCETGITQPKEDPTLEQGLIWCDTRSWRLCITFHLSLHMIWCISAQFPQIAQIPKYLWNRYNPTQRRPNSRARSHLMWYKELKTLYYFSCVPALDLGYSGPVSLNWTNTLVPVKTGIAQHTKAPALE